MVGLPGGEVVVVVLPGKVEVVVGLGMWSVSL